MRHQPVGGALLPLSTSGCRNPRLLEDGFLVGDGYDQRPRHDDSVSEYGYTVCKFLDERPSPVGSARARVLRNTRIWGALPGSRILSPPLSQIKT
jgi:hypothetical protein